MSIYVNLDPQIKAYKSIVVSHTLIRYHILIFTCFPPLFPLALVAKHLLRGLDSQRRYTLMAGKIFFVALACFETIGIILIASSMSEGMGEQQQKYFGQYSAFAAILSIWAVWWLNLKSISGLRLLPNFSADNLCDFRPILEEHTFKEIFRSLFRGSEFYQPSKLVRLLSNSINFVSQFIVFLFFILLFSSIISTTLGISQKIKSLGLPLTSTEKYEYFILLSSQIAGGILFILILAPIFAIASSLLRKAGDSVNRKNIDNYRKNDPRQPVLLLRSFLHEQILLDKSTTAFVFRLLTGEYLIKNMDNLLEKKFWSVGPIFSLADPEKNLERMSGSLKQQLGNHDWFEKIKELIDASRAVIVSLGTTPSVIQEVEYLHRNNYLHKTIFVFGRENKFCEAHFENIPLLSEFAGIEELARKAANVKAIYYKNGKPAIVATRFGDPLAFAFLISYALTPNRLEKDRKSIRPLSNRRFVYYSLFLTCFSFPLMMAVTATISNNSSGVSASGQDQKTKSETVVEAELHRLFEEHMRKTIEMNKQLNSEIEKIGFAGLLNGNDFEKEKLTDYLNSVQAARHIYAKYESIMHSDYGSLIAEQNRLIPPEGLSDEFIDIRNNQIKEDKSKIKKKFSNAYELVDQLEKLLNFMHSKKSEWEFSNGEILFANQEDADYFNLINAGISTILIEANSQREKSEQIIKELPFEIAQ